MYEELVEGLRNNADHYMTVDGEAGLVHLLTDAADAIEKLNRKVEDFEAMREISPEAEYAINKHTDSLISKLDELISDSEDKPREVKINLNELVKVRLTDLGKDIYCRWYDKLMEKRGRVIYEPKLPKDDKGYTPFQLWDFMEIYGKYMGMAKPNVIEPLEIIYELPKEEV